MDGFRFPRKIIYMGRFLTAKRIKAKDGVLMCLYEDDDLGIQTSFTETEFKYNERYGLIDRRETWTEQSK